MKCFVIMALTYATDSGGWGLYVSGGCAVTLAATEIEGTEAGRDVFCFFISSCILLKVYSTAEWAWCTVARFYALHRICMVCLASNFPLFGFRVNAGEGAALLWKKLLTGVLRGYRDLADPHTHKTLRL